jgi:4-alpha-glucanotransferase
MNSYFTPKLSIDFHLRRAGVLLHPTSLPSGRLDDDVERWLQCLDDSGFSVWQMLPLGEPQDGLSPYQCSSAFAMNPNLLAHLSAVNTLDHGFVEFCQQQQFWLDDYALFKVLKKHFDGISWSEWPDDWKFRQPQQMQQAHQQFETAITELKWQQYQIHLRWQQIKLTATEKNILLFGDMPIFVAYDSADVWAHPEWFMLDEDGKMTIVTGVPPDYFSTTGQRWGNPHYNWDAMQNSGFSWWMCRIKHHFEQFDLLRIDHFRGLESAWMINADCETAVDGHWQQVPGDALLEKINNDYHQLPLVAEDLGIITPQVTELRKRYGLPGMSILQFGFDEFEDSPHKPQNIAEDNVVYTGTHDNDTTIGWFNSLQDHIKNNVLQKLNITSNNEQNIAQRVLQVLIAQAMSSRASLCVIPMQDFLGLDTEARMNVPGTINGNWQWRFQWQQLDNNRINIMKEQIENTHRLTSTMSF